MKEKTGRKRQSASSRSVFPSFSAISERKMQKLPPFFRAFASEKEGKNR